MKLSSTIATLRQLASMRLPARMTQGTLSHLMLEILGAETFTILWVDGHCNPRDIYSNHLCPRELGNHFIAHYFNSREAEAYEPHRKFMLGTSRYDLLHRSTAYRRTGFYQDFAQPMRFASVVRFAVRSGTKPIAAVWMTRPPGDREFSGLDLTRLSGAIDYAEHILVGGSERIQCDSPSGESSWLIANATGVVQHFSDGAENLLHMAADVPRCLRTLSTPCYDWARPLLRRLADRVAALERGSAAAIPTLSVTNVSGQYTLRAHRLHDVAGGTANLIGVQINRRVPLTLRLLELPRVRVLPAREKQTCLMLVQGMTTHEIAARMGISTNGVAQHVRTLYRRLRIHRRKDLLPALTG